MIMSRQPNRRVKSVSQVLVKDFGGQTTKKGYYTIGKETKRAAVKGFSQGVESTVKRCLTGLEYPM